MMDILFNFLLSFDCKNINVNKLQKCKGEGDIEIAWSHDITKIFCPRNPKACVSNWPPFMLETVIFTMSPEFLRRMDVFDASGLQIFSKRTSIYAHLLLARQSNPKVVRQDCARKRTGHFSDCIRISNTTGYQCPVSQRFLHDVHKSSYSLWVQMKPSQVFWLQPLVLLAHLALF